MAITVGTITYGQPTPLGSSDYGISHTVASGTKVLVLGSTSFQPSSSNGGVSAKWNGVSATIAANSQNISVNARIFYIQNPTVGTYDAVFHDDLNSGFSPNSPQVFVANLSGDISTTASPVGDTHTGDGASGDEDQTYTVQGAGGVQFDIFTGNTSATVDGSSTIIFENVGIGGTRKAAASYRSHTGSNFTTAHTADQVSTVTRYAGAEFKEGSDFIPQIWVL